MHRIDADGHVDNRFVDADPSLGRPGTKVSADWLNAVNDELANAVEAGGLELDKENNTQLAEVLAGYDDRIEDLEKRVVDDEWTYPETKTRHVLVPLELALPYAPGGADPQWGYGLDSAFSATQRIWLGFVAGDVLQFPLGHLVPSGGVPTGLKILARPSVARAAAGDRMLFELVRQSVAFGAVPAPPTSTVLASARDNGKEDLQIIDLPVGTQPPHDRSGHALFLRVVTGTEIGPRGDGVVGVQLSFADPGPRNG